MAAVDNSTSDSSSAVESNSASANANFSNRSNNTTDPDFDIYAGDNEFAEVNLFFQRNVLLLTAVSLFECMFILSLQLGIRNTR